jgi:hypothetical protein
MFGTPRLRQASVERDRRLTALLASMPDMPAVSTRQSTGMSKRSAISISRTALR